MGVKNYLIDGVSCAGKTTVCDEMQRRGYQVVHGDKELAYWGNLHTGQAVEGNADEARTWIWDIEKVRALVADHSDAATFFCGGSRNTDRFISLFDAVFVLEIDSVHHSMIGIWPSGIVTERFVIFPAPNTACRRPAEAGRFSILNFSCETA
jgi:hypothetical protein